jgi:regulator of nonsense transcripts 1
MAHFKVSLVDKITVDDDCWNYGVNNLPHEKHIYAEGLVKLISAISNAKKQEITLSFIQAPRNRATSSEPFDKLALISFADFRLRHADKTNTQETYPAPAKDSTNYIIRLLSQGISINGVTYNFFGHSSSQLKSRSCFLLSEPKEVIRNKIQGLGDFKR